MRATLRTVCLLSVLISCAGLAFAKSNSSVTVASSINPSTFGSSVKFTATVTPSTCAGGVTFLDGGSTLGTGTLGSGKATFSTSALTAGSHLITASYNGNSNCNSGTSSSLTQTV